MLKISDTDKWKAVIACNKDYDGLFFYAVKTTKIFCRPSCRSKLPLRKNVIFFGSSEDALREGYRPCKRCRPDLLTYDPNTELIAEIKIYINSNYHCQIGVKTLAKDFGISPSHLSKIFKASENLSLIDYITRRRIEKSLELLRDKDLKVIDIAYSVGFQSLSNYYRSFKKQVNLTPGEFRRLDS